MSENMRSGKGDVRNFTPVIHIFVWFGKRDI